MDQEKVTPPCWCGGEVRTYFHPTFLLAVCVPCLLQVCLTSRQRLASHLPKDLERHRFPPSDAPSIIPAGRLGCDKTLKYHCPRTHSRRQQRRPVYEAKPRRRSQEGALRNHGGAGFFENKHAAVPKPFRILKRRQSTNL